MTEPTHYNQKPKRRAEYIRPRNVLKEKVGSGGLSEDILNKAQALLENNTVDFLPLGEIYLNKLMAGIEKAKNRRPTDDLEYCISNMLYPAMQLKANGGMFHYPLVTVIADKLIQFLEVIETLDLEALDAWLTSDQAGLQNPPPQEEVVLPPWLEQALQDPPQTALSSSADALQATHSGSGVSQTPSQPSPSSEALQKLRQKNRLAQQRSRKYA